MYVSARGWLFWNTSVVKMGDDSKADFNLNFEDMDFLEIFNSDNDRFTGPQSNIKPGQSDSCDQLQSKDSNNTWICYSFECLNKSNNHS